MLRFALAALLLSGCHHGGAGGLAWPERAAREADGGESLAPHQARAIAAAGLTDDSAGDDKAVTADKPTATVDAPKLSVPTPGAPTPPDDSLFGDDDMTIEISD